MKAISIEECQKIMVTLPPIKRYLTKNMCHWTWPIEKAIKFPTTQAPFMGFAGHFMDPALHAHSHSMTCWMVNKISTILRRHSLNMNIKNCYGMINIPKFHPCCTIHLWTSHPQDVSTKISIRNMQFLHCLSILIHCIWHHPPKRLEGQWQ